MTREQLERRRALYRARYRARKKASPDGLREHHRIKAAEYREKNRTKFNKYMREYYRHWRKLHPSTAKRGRPPIYTPAQARAAKAASAKRWQTNHPEEYKAYQRQWRLKNRNKYLEDQRRWREQNREYTRIKARMYMRNHRKAK
jgi:hypothetical protein